MKEGKIIPGRSIIRLDVPTSQYRAVHNLVIQEGSLPLRGNVVNGTSSLVTDLDRGTVFRVMDGLDNGDIPFEATIYDCHTEGMLKNGVGEHKMMGITASNNHRDPEEY